MEQTNFSIRKYFEELRAFTAFRDGLIKICLEDQETICKQVEAQEKKYKDNINLLLVIIQGLQAQSKFQEANTQDTISTIDILQRVVEVLSVTRDAIARDKVVTKMLEHIEQL